MVHRKDWVCTPELVDLLNIRFFFSPENSPWSNPELFGGEDSWARGNMLTIASFQKEGFEDWSSCQKDADIHRSNAHCHLCDYDFWEDRAVWFLDDGSVGSRACFKCTIDILGLDKVATKQVDFRKYLASTSTNDRFGQTYFATGIWNDLIAEIHCFDNPPSSVSKCGRCSENIAFDEISEHWAWRFRTYELLENIHAECVSEFEFYTKDSELPAKALKLVSQTSIKSTSIESRLERVKDLLDKNLISEDEAKVKRDEILKDL